MARLSVSREAKRDLIEIYVYIARDNPDAAERHHERLHASFLTIAQQPGVGRLREELAPGIRSLPVGNYVVYYRKTKQTTRILRVLHAARDIAQFLL